MTSSHLCDGKCINVNIGNELTNIFMNEINILYHQSQEINTMLNTIVMDHLPM